MRIIDHKLIAQIQEAHFIGIGGVGMSALARVLKHMGVKVTGSDCKQTERTDALAADGIEIIIAPERVKMIKTDLVVYSSAIKNDHPELKEARKQGLHIYHRAEVLASLFNQAKTSIGITGAHGKTTTSAMVSFVLHAMGKKPTCLVGGDMMDFETNTILGDSDLWVSEVDESDQSHELYCPNYSVITNLEEDHVDHYADFHQIKESFSRFFENAVNPGLLVYCEDDETLTQLVRESGKPAVGYGFKSAATFSAQNIQKLDFGSEFDLCEAGFYVCRVKLSVPGTHNILNALATIAVLSQLGLSLDLICGAIAKFRGTKRRFEVKWKTDGLIVIDDYAHHPTEVQVVVETLKHLGKPLTVIFQPHRYSRTERFYKQFAKSFLGADQVIITSIYGAGEANDQNISGSLIFDELISNGVVGAQWLERSELIPYLTRQQEVTGVVAFLGAGDIGEIANEFTDRFKYFTTA